VATPGVVREGNAGLEVMVSFTIGGCRGLPCSAGLQFCGRGGEPLRDQNGQFRNEWGEVAVRVDFVPEYETTDGDGLSLWIPYAEWHLPPGHQELFWRVGIHGPHGSLTWAPWQGLALSVSS
jgi:hypothetical protein